MQLSATAVTTRTLEGRPLRKIAVGLHRHRARHGLHFIFVLTSRHTLAAQSGNHGGLLSSPSPSPFATVRWLLEVMYRKDSSLPSTLPRSWSLLERASQGGTVQPTFREHRWTRHPREAFFYRTRVARLCPVVNIAAGKHSGPLGLPVATSWQLRSPVVAEAGR